MQELLGPPKVNFYAANEEWLGSKQTLALVINEITGISIPALNGTPLSQINVEERMAWAQGRDTKRPEDKAYSLLGIFGVSMPVLYGEGERNAMKRLGALLKELAKDYDPVRIGGASYSDLVKLNEKNLAKLDLWLVATMEWMLKAGEPQEQVDQMSEEAGRRVRLFLEHLGVTYHDESHLKSSVTEWSRPWRQYLATKETDADRLRGFLENRWYWANSHNDSFTGIIAARTLLDLMNWRGIDG